MEKAIEQEKISKFLTDNEYFEEIKENCSRVFEKNRGATEFSVKYIENYIKELHENY